MAPALARELPGSSSRDPEKEAEFRRDLDGVYGDILAVQEDILLAEGEGVDIARPKVRAERAEGLYHEAIEALNRQDYTLTGARIQAARSMVQTPVQPSPAEGRTRQWTYPLTGRIDHLSP